MRSSVWSQWQPICMTDTDLLRCTGIPLFIKVYPYSLGGLFSVLPNSWGPSLFPPV